jgi:SnoaL-like protein
LIEEMEKVMQSLSPRSEAARTIVISLLETINQEDFKTARTFLQDDMKYIGVFGSRDGAEAALGEVQQLLLKFQIKEVIAEDNQVAVFYDLSTSGITLFAAGWFQIKDDKVSLIRVVFDPRPVLEMMSKR